MKFKIEIECDNDAFYDPEFEVVRILQDVRERIQHGDANLNRTVMLYDINGNRVGEARWVK